MEKVWIEKLAIQELCSRYCQTIDAQDSDGWARCFLPDGVFQSASEMSATLLLRAGIKALPGTRADTDRL